MSQYAWQEERIEKVDNHIGHGYSFAVPIR